MKHFQFTGTDHQFGGHSIIQEANTASNTIDVCLDAPLGGIGVFIGGNRRRQLLQRHSIAAIRHSDVPNLGSDCSFRTGNNIIELGNGTGYCRCPIRQHQLGVDTAELGRQCAVGFYHQIDNICCSRQSGIRFDFNSIQCQCQCTVRLQSQIQNRHRFGIYLCQLIYQAQFWHINQVDTAVQTGCQLCGRYLVA